MNKKYKSMVIVGSQWGDEGKGKATDYFAQKADMVVRFSGGDNAGHIIKIDGNAYKVTIVPSGIFNPKTINVIANGCVINLEKLNSEIADIEAQGFSTNNLLISDRAHVIMPYNLLIDELQEEYRKENKIGTTKRGIGPTYSDKVARMGIRIHDFKNPNFKNILEENVNYHNALIKNIYGDDRQFSLSDIYENLMNNFKKIESKVVDTGELIAKTIEENKIVLFEGAQGVLLDIDHGTYPFVTSSNTSANNAPTGSGISQKHISKVLGIVKAYNSRVGAGSMITEIPQIQTVERIRVRGHEYGSNTKRPRRIGWLDLVALKYAIRVGGISDLFLTLMDVLDTEEKIKVCVGYELNGKVLTSMPASEFELLKCKPVYKELKGWQKNISDVKSFKELPLEAQQYIRFIEEFTNTPMAGFSVGPNRNQTILLKDLIND